MSNSLKNYSFHVLDDIDLVILIEIEKHSSLQEIAFAVQKAVSTIQSRLTILEREEYITNEKGQHRSRRLTQKGKDHVTKHQRVYSKAPARG